MCTQMLMHSVARGGCTDTRRRVCTALMSYIPTPFGNKNKRLLSATFVEMNILIIGDRHAVGVLWSFVHSCFTNTQKRKVKKRTCCVGEDTQSLTAKGLTQKNENVKQG